MDLGQSFLTITEPAWSWGFGISCPAAVHKLTSIRRKCAPSTASSPFKSASSRLEEPSPSKSHSLDIARRYDSDEGCMTAWLFLQSQWRDRVDSFGEGNVYCTMHTSEIKTINGRMRRIVFCPSRRTVLTGTGPLGVQLRYIWNTERGPAFSLPQIRHQENNKNAGIWCLEINISLSHSKTSYWLQKYNQGVS